MGGAGQIFFEKHLSGLAKSENATVLFVPVSRSSHTSGHKKYSIFDFSAVLRMFFSRRCRPAAACRKIEPVGRCIRVDVLSESSLTLSEQAQMHVERTIGRTRRRREHSGAGGGLSERTLDLARRAIKPKCASFRNRRPIGGASADKRTTCSLACIVT